MIKEKALSIAQQSADRQCMDYYAVEARNGQWMVETRAFVEGPIGQRNYTKDRILFYPLDPAVKPYYTRVLIRDGRNVLVVVHRDRKVALPGGKLDPGETAEQAAVREVKEETGLEVHELRKVLENVYEFQSGRHRAIFFEATSWSGVPVNLEPAKLEYVGWVPEEFLMVTQHERVTDTLKAARG